MSKRRWLRYFAASPTTDPGQRSAVRSETASSGRSGTSRLLLVRSGSDLARDDRRGGFVSPDCYGYLPCIQLCVCYSHLGDQKRAETFNELAAACKPDSSAVLHNRAIFQSLSESLPR